MNHKENDKLFEQPNHLVILNWIVILTFHFVVLSGWWH